MPYLSTQTIPARPQTVAEAERAYHRARQHREGLQDLRYVRDRAFAAEDRALFALRRALAAVPRKVVAGW